MCHVRQAARVQGAAATIPARVALVASTAPHLAFKRARCPLGVMCRPFLLMTAQARATSCAGSRSRREPLFFPLRGMAWLGLSGGAPRASRGGGPGGYWKGGGSWRCSPMLAAPLPPVGRDAGRVLGRARAPSPAPDVGVSRPCRSSVRRPSVPQVISGVWVWLVSGTPRQCVRMRVRRVPEWVGGPRPPRAGGPHGRGDGASRRAAGGGLAVDMLASPVGPRYAGRAGGRAGPPHRGGGGVRRRLSRRGEGRAQRQCLAHPCAQLPPCRPGAWTRRRAARDDRLDREFAWFRTPHACEGCPCSAFGRPA